MARPPRDTIHIAFQESQYATPANDHAIQGNKPVGIAIHRGRQIDPARGGSGGVSECFQYAGEMQQNQCGNTEGSPAVGSASFPVSGKRLCDHLDRGIESQWRPGVVRRGETGENAATTTTLSSEWLFGGYSGKPLPAPKNPHNVRPTRKQAKMHIPEESLLVPHQSKQTSVESGSDEISGRTPGSSGQQQQRQSWGTPSQRYWETELTRLSEGYVDRLKKLDQGDACEPEEIPPKSRYFVPHGRGFVAPPANHSAYELGMYRHIGDTQDGANVAGESAALAEEEGEGPKERNPSNVAGGPAVAMSRDQRKKEEALWLRDHINFIGASTQPTLITQGKLADASGGATSAAAAGASHSAKQTTRRFQPAAGCAEDVALVKALPDLPKNRYPINK